MTTEPRGKLEVFENPTEAEASLIAEKRAARARKRQAAEVRSRSLRGSSRLSSQLSDSR